MEISLDFSHNWVSELLFWSSFQSSRLKEFPHLLSGGVSNGFPVWVLDFPFRFGCRICFAEDSTFSELVSECLFRLDIETPLPIRFPNVYSHWVVPTRLPKILRLFIRMSLPVRFPNCFPHWASQVPKLVSDVLFRLGPQP